MTRIEFDKLVSKKYDEKKWVSYCENNVRHLNEKDIVHLLQLFVLT
jgi:hypothetical protein